MKRKVTIQGVAGCYHDAAARAYFHPQEIDTVPCDTFNSMFETLETDASLLGILAIENTIAGALLQNHFGHGHCGNICVYHGTAVCLSADGKI